MIFDHVIVNGTLMPLDQALVSLFNPAYFSSFGVYETVKIDRGRPFYLEEHLHRLLKSAQMIDLTLGVTVPTLNSWFDALLSVDPQATWSLKIIAIGPAERGETPTIGLQATPLATYPAKFYESGASAILYPGERLMPTCKSLNTLLNFLARRAATEAGALEGLLHHNGYLSEGSRSNLFAVIDGQLVTPPTGSVLSGITREVIMEVMPQTGHPVVEGRVPADPARFEEFFISSTSMHVMPISQIDGRPVGDGQVGPITRLAMRQFNRFYQQMMASA